MRTPSVSTFDSLELGRYSDDGREGDEKVAGETTSTSSTSCLHVAFCISVLEFELRKAYDTIKSLRGSLTKASDITSNKQGEQSTPASSLSEVDRECCTYTVLYLRYMQLYSHYMYSIKIVHAW